MADLTATSSGLHLSLPGKGGLRQLALLICIGLVLAAAFSALAFERQTVGQLENMAAVEGVQRHARDLLASLNEAESSVRGFLLVHDDEFRNASRSALSGVDEHRLALIDGAGTWPAERERAVSIDQAVGEERDELARIVSLIESGEVDAARTIVESPSSRSLMAGIHSSIGSLLTREDAQRVELAVSLQQTRLLLLASILAALAAAVAVAATLLTGSDGKELARARGVLLAENEALARRVQDSTAESEEAQRHADSERQRVEALLQDANHRIGNSLATVSSLLALQMMRTRSEDVRSALDSARARVHAIASGHRRLRLGGDYETIRADEFLQAVTDDLRVMQAFTGDLTVITAFDPMLLRARDATTVGILLGELVTNAFKHAFGDGEGGRVWISFGLVGGVPALSVADNGRGMPADGEGQEEGLGSVVVRQLALPFKGKPQYAQRDGGGTNVVIPLPGLIIPAPEASP